MATSSVPVPFTFKGSMDTYASMEGQKRESPAAERNKGHILEVLREYLAGEAATAAATAAAAAAGRARPLILEVASGSGQHCAHLAAGLPAFDLQPTDLTPELFSSITAYAATATATAAATTTISGSGDGSSIGGGGGGSGGGSGGSSVGLANVRLPPLVLNAAADDWPAVAAAGLYGSGSSSGGGGLEAAAVMCANMCHISPLAATRGLLRGAGQALRRGGGLLFVYGPFTRDGGVHTSDSNAAFDSSLRARDPAWGYRDLDDMAAWAAEAGLEAVEVRDMPANNFMLVFRRP